MTTSSSSNNSSTGRSSLLSSKRRLSSLDDHQLHHHHHDNHHEQAPKRTPTPDPQNTLGSFPGMDLATFLWQTPFLFHYSFNDAAKRTLIKKCYTTLWKNQDALMEQYFFKDRGAFHDAIDRLMLHRHSRTHNQDGMERMDMQSGGDAATTTTAAAQQQRPLQRCGRVFRKGEPVYRCRDCRLDDSCVLCSKCFHASNHENHNVLVAISPGSGGCCDCGDPEAWKTALECSVHGTTPANNNNNDPSNNTSSSSSSSATLPRSVIKHIRQTIITVMDFVLVTFALASEEISIPASNADIVQANQNECAIFRRMGVPARRPLYKSKQRRSEGDVDMDKENHGVDDDQLYVLVAWNDETHSFKDACDAVEGAIGCHVHQARTIVETIHTQGREIIGTSTNLDELRTMAAPFTAIGLGVTIRPARDVIREQVTTVLVDWLREMAAAAASHHQGLSAQIRSIICEELCANWKLPKQIAIMTGGTPSFRMVSEEEEEEEEEEEDEDDQPIEYHEDQQLQQQQQDPLDEEEEEEETMMMGFETTTTTTMDEEDVDMDAPDQEEDEEQRIPSDVVVPMLVETDSKILYQTEKDIASIDWNPAWLVKDHRHFQVEEQSFATPLGLPARQDIRDMNETRRLAFAVQREFEQKQRLDYFLLYDQRVWKELRVSLREFYILTLGSHPVYKKRFGKRLVRNYARLVEAFLFRDREPENAIILFSVQLLTVPSVCSLLVNEYYFFGLICNTLSVFFMTEEICYVPISKQQDQPRRLSCESRAFRTRRYFNAFHDLRYILHVELLKPVIAHDAVYLREFLELISLFQAMNPQTCQKDTHVEYESEVWVNAFNVTLQIAKCCRSFSDCYHALLTATQHDRAHTAQILVRAVARVLKAIDDWGAEPIDKTRLPLPQVPATKEYRQHKVTLPYVGDINVVQYDITSDPVSFHHPLHWLLAGILESATWLDSALVAEAGWNEGFFNAIKMFAAQDDDLLPRVLDFPIRTLAFSSQIRAGVWVRNGYNIRNQVHHYRDISLRETTYDSDIFLLQFAFVSTNPSKVLATLMDRFDLLDWFSGETTHKQYDNSQVIFMVEEILYLLIVCISERGNPTHASLQQKIRREIIHHLCLGSSVYSELTKRIPERLSEQAEFDQLLNEVANFKPPTSLNDSGRYELKDEYFDAIDPYFWHYSRNNRGEAELVLKERWKKANADKDEAMFFVRPKPLEPIAGPFQGLYQLLETPVLVQMATFTLTNVRQMDEAHKSDTVIDEVLYLLLLAVSSPTFCNYATELTYGSSTLFDMLMQYRTDEQAKETHARLDWIFEQMMTHGSDNTRQRMQSYQAMKKQSTPGGNDEEHDMSEQERKKKAARERQKRIMEIFAQAQLSFMEQNEDLYEEEEEEAAAAAAMEGAGDEQVAMDNQQVCEYPTGTCIVCQEDVNERSLPYGMLGLVQVSNILREADMSNRAMFDEMDRMGPNLDCTWPMHQISDQCGSFPAVQDKSGLCATTCGHLMHIKCFETYNASIDPRHAAQLTRNHPENRLRKEFTCPLCKSLGNMLLPIIWKGKIETYPGVISNADEDAYSRFLQTELHMAAERLQTAIDPSRPIGFGVWSAGADMLFAPRLPSLKGMQVDTASGTSGDKIPGLSTLLGVEQQHQRRNRLGPTEMLFKSAVGVIPAIQSAYVRLQEVFSVILGSCSPETARSLSASVNNVDTLWGMLGFTIAAMEITARGNDSNGHMVFTQIPMQAQTLLRILCDTSMSYTGLMCSNEQEELLSSSRLFSTGADDASGAAASGGSTGTGTGAGATGTGPDSRSMVQVHMLAMQRLLQIFASDTITTSRQASEVPPDTRLYNNFPLLMDDPFMVLTELSVHLVHVAKTDFHPFVRILLLAELTKTTVGLLQQPSPALDESSDDAMVDDDEQDNNDQEAAKELLALVANAMGINMDTHSQRHRLCRMLKMFTLPYLRRTIILLITRFGLLLDPSSQQQQQQQQQQQSSDNEFDRLLGILRLPKLATLIRHPDTEQLVRGWCSQLVKENERRSSMQEDDDIVSQDNTMGIDNNVRVVLDLPTPFQLISLPSRLDVLMDESTRKICPRCETVPTDPAVCLLCGAFVCSQSFCCSEGEEGECNLHMLECGGEIGIYLLIKRCSLLVLHNENGWFMQPPYLDAHGEIDQGLRRGRPQYLNTQRYADTRRLWLQHGIPAYVARQIEATYDVGGWTTL